MKLTAIIQARMGSSRLQGKVLRNLIDRPVLAHVVGRATAAKRVQRVVVATSDLSADDAIENWCRSSGVDVFRGSETDVLDRFLSAAEWCCASTVARITADCPMLDPEIVDRVAELYFSGGFDYASNVNPPTFPDGLDVEVFSVEVLRAVSKRATESADREHVTRYIRARPDEFRIGNLTNTPDLSHLRWTLDTEADFERINNIFNRVGRPMFGMKDVLHQATDSHVP